MKIGALSKQTGLTIDAICFYEKSGLIKGPDRNESGYRQYCKDAVAAIEFISRCRALGIPIPKIKKLLNVRSGSAKSCREANQVVEEQLANLRVRIQEMKKLESSLAQLRSVCNQELEPGECPIIKSLQNA